MGLPSKLIYYRLLFIFISSILIIFASQHSYCFSSLTNCHMEARVSVVDLWMQDQVSSMDQDVMVVYGYLS